MDAFDPQIKKGHVERPADGQIEPRLGRGEPDEERIVALACGGVGPNSSPNSTPQSQLFVGEANQFAGSRDELYRPELTLTLGFAMKALLGVGVSLSNRVRISHGHS